MWCRAEEADAQKFITRFGGEIIEPDDRPRWPGKVLTWCGPLVPRAGAERELVMNVSAYCSSDKLNDCSGRSSALGSDDNVARCIREREDNLLRSIGCSNINNAQSTYIPRRNISAAQSLSNKRDQLWHCGGRLAVRIICS